MSFWVLVDKVIRGSDVVLLILDARMPELSRNVMIENKVRRMGRDFILVFNKVDLISKEELAELKKKYIYSFFVSGAKNLGLKQLKRHLLMEAKRSKIGLLRVGIVGYPNVGKSAIINALAHRAHAKVSSKAGTTQGVQWINVGEHLKLLDTPGVIPIDEHESSLGMLGAKNPEKLKNPERVALDIIKMMIEKNLKSFEGFYGIKAEAEPYDVMLLIGKKRGFLVKGGNVDENRTALQIIRDWNTGKIKN